MNRRDFNQTIAGLLMTGTLAQTSHAQPLPTIKVGITPAGQPASGLNAQTRVPEGFAVEIIRAIATDAGLAVEFLPMPFADLQRSLLERSIDAIAGTFGITADRQKVVDFTHPYGQYQDRLLVKASDTSTYRSIADLKGMKIATSRGSSYVKPLEDAGADLSLSATPPESLAKLVAGSVAGVVDNELQLNHLLRTGDTTGLRLVNGYQPILVGQLAFAVRKDDADLLMKLDGSLAKLQASGMVAAIKRKWSLE